ncbi:unnamed protein product, partial [Didymodactylos carnosus]
FASVAMDSVLTSLLGKSYTMSRKQAWSFLFQQIAVDLTRGVEEQALLDAKQPHTSIFSTYPIFRTE